VDAAGTGVQRAGKRGRKHASDLQSVVNAMLYICHTGYRWRILPEGFCP
jgi:putative transposase